MIRLLWAVSVRVRYVCRRYLPSNILLDLIRTRRSLKCGVPAMLLAIPYFSIAYGCTTLLSRGAPGWLNLIVLMICVWSGMKMLWIGPVSLILLARARMREARARRVQRQTAGPGREQEDGDVTLAGVR